MLVMIIGLLAPRESLWGYSASDGALGVFLTVVALPALIVWALLEVMHTLRPRRLLIGDRRSTALLIGWGFLTAGLTVIGATLTLSWLDRTVGDALIFGVCAAVSAVLLFPLLPRWRKGHCVYCNYDQRGATVRSGGCCVECGRPQPVPAYSSSP